MTVLNVSFAACGFLGIYHLGAVGAFLRHGARVMTSLGACAGASAGALVAAVMITAPDKLEVLGHVRIYYTCYPLERSLHSFFSVFSQECKDFTFSFADSVRRQRFGAVTPGYDFMLTLR